MSLESSARGEEEFEQNGKDLAHGLLPRRIAVTEIADRLCAQSPITQCPLIPDTIRTFAGILAFANAATRNKRVYPKGLLVREIQAYHQEYILPGTAFGELHHPSAACYWTSNCNAFSHQILAVWWKGDELYGLIRLLDSAAGRHAGSLRIVAVWWKGDELYGLIRLLDSAAGRQARRMLAAGNEIGASLRCWTSLHEDAATGLLVAQPDMKLITFDLTPQPATGCFLKPLTQAAEAKLSASLPRLLQAPAGRCSA